MAKDKGKGQRWGSLLENTIKARPFFSKRILGPPLARWKKKVVIPVRSSSSLLYYNRDDKEEAKDRDNDD